MNNAQIGKAFSCAVIFAAGLGLGSLLTPTPSKALEDASQLLSGGMTGVAANQTAFSAPGTATALADQIGGKGESAVQIRHAGWHSSQVESQADDSDGAQRCDPHDCGSEKR
jgi:hypothetical protein